MSREVALTATARPQRAAQKSEITARRLFTSLPAYAGSVRNLSGFRERCDSRREASRDLPLVRARLQARPLGGVRHEAGLDEDRGDVRPVEAGQVAALDEAVVLRARGSDGRPLNELCCAQAARVDVVRPAAM